MNIADAQREMRSAFMGGFVGQLVSGAIWAASALISLLVEPFYGMAALFLGSMLLFPLTQLFLRLLGRPAAVSHDNTLDQLARQIAFTVPINFLLVAAATLYRQEWFYPASLITVGAHYLPFVFLYGMPAFGILGALLIAAGTAIAFFVPGFFSLGGWAGALLLVAFAFVGRRVAVREESRVVEMSYRDEKNG